MATGSGDPKFCELKSQYPEQLPSLSTVSVSSKIVCIVHLTVTRVFSELRFVSGIISSVSDTWFSFITITEKK